MVQAQGVYAGSGASAQVNVEGITINLPLIIGGLAIIGVIVAAVVLRK